MGNCLGYSMSKDMKGKQFMDLNDDCLREICYLVSAIDLCSLLELSEMVKSIRLKEITNEIFSRKYKICNLNREVGSVDEVQRLLTNFGPLISDLKAKYSGEDSTVIIRSIIRFCCETLKSLNIQNFNVNGIDRKATFRKLENLEMDDCNFEGDSIELFAHCKSLIKLFIVQDTPSNKAILQYTFPKLEHFCFQWNNESCKSFISRHKKLKVLAFSRSCHLALLPVIAANCSEIKELWLFCDDYERSIENVMAVKSISKFNLEVVRIHTNPNAVRFLQQLTYLQSLKKLPLEFTHFGKGVLSELTKLTFLEQLTIYKCEEFKNFNSLAELCRLRQLRIVSNENVNFDLVYIVSRLTNLENLFLCLLMGFTVDEIIYSRIVNARLKAGSAHRTLRIECGTTKFTFPREV